MAFDYKKEYKEYYMPNSKPEIIEIPAMNFISIRGCGDPNEENGAYKAAIGLLYQVAFTIKMSRKGDHKLEGYFDFVVPPLEGFWWQEHPDNASQIDYTHKENFQWISLIRLPDFVTQADFDWAIDEASHKKKLDLSPVTFLTYNEGLCVQCMHIGTYDSEPETIARMNQCAEIAGYDIAITTSRYHHEIYLSDARKCDPAKLKTVIRHPVKKREHSRY